MHKPLILVVGAGPTGLFFAYEMIKRGHSVRIIDRKQELSQESKAVAIHARTQEILAQAGMIKDFLDQGIPSNVQFHLDHKDVLIDFSQLPTPYPSLLIISQADSEKILDHHLRLAGGKVEWNTELVHIQNGECILKQANGQIEKLTPDWIIGADGGRSIVRTANDISFNGKGLSQTFILADFTGDVQLAKERLHICFGSLPPLLIIPLPKNLYRALFPTQTNEEAALSKDHPELLLQAIHQRGVHEVVKVDQIVWVSQFHIRTCLASTFKHHNCFLMGDAAHIHSPFGGQGMNMSLQDAYNLSWKLDLVLSHVASNTLLDSYSPERKEVVSKILRTTELGTAAIISSPRWLRACEKIIIRLLNLSKKFKYKFSFNASQLGCHYRSSAIVLQPDSDKKWKGPRPGERAPYVLLKNGSSFDLFKSQKHVVLLFKPNSEVQALIKPMKKWVDCHVISDEALLQAFAAESNSIYVIRPDGYIGYRSRLGDLTVLKEYFSLTFDTYQFQSQSHQCSCC